MHKTKIQGFQVFNGQISYHSIDCIYTTDTIAKIAAHVYQAMENKMATMSVFLDLSKAFDTIYHAIVLKKMYYYGIRGIALEWLRHYLTDRSQFVSCKDTL